MKEVRAQDWSSFCRKVTENEGNATMTIELLDRQGARSTLAEQETFRELAFERADACNDRITIRGGDSGGTEHEVLGPIRVTLEETEGGKAFRSVVIQGEEGVTAVRLQPVIRAEWLNGIQLQ